MYRGKCPLCSAQLELREKDILHCSKADHFVIFRMDFEKAWGTFDASQGDADDTKRLLADLGVVETVEAIVEKWRTTNEPR